MSVTACQVQKVLRTYGRQLSRSPHLLRSNPQSEAESSDSVSISARARRLHVVERVAADQAEQEALARLSGEYGENLGVLGVAEGEIRLAVVNSIVLAGQCLVHLEHPHGRDLEALLLQAGDDLACESLLDAIGLDQN